MPRADLRLGQRWTPGQRIKNEVLWLLASTALRACGPLPPAALRWLGRRLGALALVIASGDRRRATANVARVFPALSEAKRRAFVRRCFATLGAHLGDTISLLGARPVGPLPIQPRALEVFRTALGQGRGVVFASAHLGPWERVAGSLASAGIPIAVLARESYDPRFTELYARMRARQGLEVVWRGQPGAAARILRTLRRNAVLGVPMDLRSRVASCLAPFLGYDAPTALGPARIALRARAPVVVGTAAGTAQGGELEVTATPLPTSDLDGGRAAAEELTRRINAELSSRILAMPHAWLWMHDRWERTPEEVAGGALPEGERHPVVYPPGHRGGQVVRRAQSR